MSSDTMHRLQALRLAIDVRLADLTQQAAAQVEEVGSLRTLLDQLEALIQEAVQGASANDTE